MKQQYVMRPGSNVKLDPITLAKELEKIREKRGKLTPYDVVEEAKDEKNPLHHEFVWDDSQAAKMYRLAQARRLIKAVCVRVDEVERHPVYYNVRVATGNCYEPATVVVKQEDLFASSQSKLVSQLFSSANAVLQLMLVAKRMGRNIDDSLLYRVKDLITDCASIIQDLK